MNFSEDLTLPEWQCEKCNLYSPQTTSALYLWCTKCEKILCALCIGECTRESHSCSPASDVIYQLKSEIITTNAQMAKSVEDMTISGKDTMRSLQGLHRTLSDLKEQCEGVDEIIKGLSKALKERYNAAEVRRKEVNERQPFTSILVQKLQAEITANKTLAHEAKAMVLTLNEAVKQSDKICKDARTLSNSFVLQKKVDEAADDDAGIESDKNIASHESDVQGFGDMLEDDTFENTVRESTNVAPEQDDQMEDSGMTGIGEHESQMLDIPADLDIHY